MKVIAKVRYLHIAPRKCRLVADLIRGMEVDKAMEQLRFLPKRSAHAFSKLLNSGIASAEHNFNLERNNLYISDIFVDGGPIMKRWKPRAFGRAYPIKKRTSHITIVLNEKVKGKKKKVKAKTPSLKKEVLEEKKEEKKVKKEKPKFKLVEETKKIKPKAEGVFKRIFRRKSA